MTTTATYTKSGAKSQTAVKLDDKVFGVKDFSKPLIKQAYIAHQANQRDNLAKTLMRSGVRGGGKKPWQQKGTGRARHGTIRSPIWRGGGVVFGPLGKENYSKVLSQKAKQTALRQTLSQAARDGKVIVIEKFETTDGKTAKAAQLLDKIGASRRILLAVSRPTDEQRRCVNNLSNVKIVSSTYLNVADVLNADSIVLEKLAVEDISNWLGVKK